ncbi:MAG: zinc ribbon domain-containing protein [Oscillospiraceae bacterium]|nr:zinc ribbon domain-containing protein [Oscillospiraceae bacterium]
MDTIYCTSCGNAMQNTAKFCTGCGTAVPEAPAEAVIAETPAEAVTPEAPVEAVTPEALPEAVVTEAAPVEAVAAETLAITEEPFSLFGLDIKKLALLGGAGAALIIALIVSLVAFSPSQYNSLKGSIDIAQTESDRFFVVTSKGANIAVEGICVDYEVNIDGTKAAFLVSDEDSINGNTLYHVSGGRVSKITEDVRSFWLASSGNGIAFTKFEPGSDAAELYLWTGSSPARKISSDVLLFSRVVISPDGKTVGFTDMDDDGVIGAFFTNGKMTDLGRNFVPVGIADGAKYIYYTREDALFVQRGTNENTRLRLTGEFNGIEGFNKDMSQIVFSSYTRSFISDRGRDPQALAGHVYRFILPANTAEFNGQRGTVYGVSSFKNTFYLNGDSSIIRVNNKFETARVQGSVSSAFLADDGKTLTYMRNGRVERLDGTRTNAEPLRLVDGDAWSFVATAKGDAIFFINSDRDIMFQRGTSRAVVVEHDVSYYTQLTLFKGNTLFYVQDLDLYSSSGRGKTRISGLNGDVLGVSVDMFNVFVVLRDGREEMYYHSTNGKSFSEIK